MWQMSQEHNNGRAVNKTDVKPIFCVLCLETCDCDLARYYVPPNASDLRFSRQRHQTPKGNGQTKKGERKTVGTNEEKVKGEGESGEERGKERNLDLPYKATRLSSTKCDLTIQHRGYA